MPVFLFYCLENDVSEYKVLPVVCRPRNKHITLEYKDLYSIEAIFN